MNTPGIVSRDDAQVLVDIFTVSVQQYQGVQQSDVTRLLGDRAAMLRSDPIRKLGPTPDFVYPWNVVDYLSNHNPRKA